MKQIRVILFVTLTILAGCGGSGAAELSKADATKLLTFMGKTNVIVAAVVNGIGGMGMGAFSSPNVALVIGYAENGEKPEELHMTFFYDKDLGWFYSDTNSRS